MKDTGRLEKEYKLRKDSPTVMIFGGSRGAEGINAAALKAIPQFAKKEVIRFYLLLVKFTMIK